MKQDHDQATTAQNSHNETGSPDAILETVDLETVYRVSGDEGTKQLRAANGVSFTIRENEAFGLVGESGCGKSTIAKSIMNVLPSNGSIAGGEINFKSRDLTELSNSEMRAVRWEDIAIITQSAMNALDPVYTVGAQIREAISIHRDMSREEMDARTAELFEMVGIDPDRMEDYPHQFSGGMKQRAMIAMALVLEPNFIIADEPTTALDVISQDTILDHLEKLIDRTGTSLLVITHDMSVISELCDRVGVMYAGEIVETGTIEEVFESPRHPYTMGLKNAFPNLHSEKEELISIPGTPPSLHAERNRCQFAERCPFATDDCLEVNPELDGDVNDHRAACIRIDEIGIDTMREQTSQRETWMQMRNKKQATVNRASTQKRNVESTED